MSEHELWNELGNLYFMAGSYDQALHAYTRAIALDKNFGRPYSNMALTWVQKGEYAEAIEYYQRGIGLLTDEREKALSWYKLGDVYRHLKDYHRAVDAYQHADGFISESSENGTQAGTLLNRTPTEDDLLRLEEEIVDDTQSNASYSGMELLPFVEELTPWWFENQIPPQEEVPGEEVMPVDVPAEVAAPDDSVVFTERLKWDRTPAYEAAVIEDAPQNVRAFDVEEKFEPAPFNTGVAYAMESAVGFAMQDSFANMVQAEQPADVQTLELDRNPEMVLVVSPEPVIVTDVPEFMAEDSTSPAAVEYEEPVEIPMVELSEIERDVIEAEIRRLEHMVTSNPRNHFVWYRLGSQYRQLGLYDKAVGAFENAVSINSSNVAYVYQLGLACSAVGRHDDAVALFERVIAMDPNQSLAHASLGGYYRKNGNLELAQVYIERARNLLPRDESEYNRACVEAICGNTDLALELLEIALQIRQSYVNLARRDPDLDFIRSDSRFHALLTQYATQPVQ